MLDAQLHFVETVDEAAAFMRWLGERRSVLGVDIESTGLKPFASDTLRLAQFGDCTQGWAIDTIQWRGVVQEALSRYEGPIIGHNAAFDRHFLEQAGFTVPPWHLHHDTMYMARLLDPNRPAGLKNVGERLFPGCSAGELVLNEAKRKGGYTWATIPTNNPAYWAYSALDPVITCRIAETMWPRIHKEGYKPAYDREMAVRAILYRCEQRGMRIDPRYTSDLLRQWEDEASLLLGELNALGLANPSSGRQIAAAMQITEGWDPVEYTPSGEPKTDVMVLKGIDSEISRRVLRYRRLVKWCSTYLRVFLQDRDRDDMVHASINTLQARTGRMSISGPALQTLPSHEPEIRNCVVPRPGRRIYAIDQKNVEMRMFAHFSGDEALMQAAKDDLDLHRFTASLVYGREMGDISSDERHLAKQSVSFGKLYGAGVDAVAASAHTTVENVQAFLAVYGDKFPGVDRFTKQVITLGKKRLEYEGTAYVTTWGGRRAPADPDRIYALVNYLIQGSCADLLKSKIIELDAADLADDIIVPVHDELLFDFPEGAEGEDMAKEAAEIMTERRMFSVPLTVDLAGPFERWGDHTK